MCGLQKYDTEAMIQPASVFLLNTQKLIHPPWKVLKAFHTKESNVFVAGLYGVFVLFMYVTDREETV